MEAVSKLRAARDENQWTQAYVAEAVGVDERTVRHWETSDVQPRGYHVRALCQLFHKPAEELGFTANHRQTLMMAAANMDNIPMTDHLSSSIRQDLTVQLMRIVWSWPQQNDQYSLLQGQIYALVNHYTDVIVEQDLDQVITRRNALRSLVLLPIEVCGLAQLGKALRHPAEDVLIQCASGIAACWYFRKGKELPLANDALTMYIPALQAIATASSTKYKKAAASLLVQCYLLKATLTRLIANHEEPVHLLTQAIHYSALSEDRVLRILAFRTMAATQYYAGHWRAALDYGLQAKHLLWKDAPRRLQSFVYAGLALYQAQQGQKDEALLSLRKAHQTFEPPVNDVPVWIDHPASNVWINDGMTHYHLNAYDQAISSLEQLDTLNPAESSADGQVEALINRALIEVMRDDQPRDRDKCLADLKAGIEGAQAIQSTQWMAEARMVHGRMMAAWPGVKQIIELGYQFSS